MDFSIERIDKLLCGLRAARRSKLLCSTARRRKALAHAAHDNHRGHVDQTLRDLPDNVADRIADVHVRQTGSNRFKQICSVKASLHRSAGRLPQPTILQFIAYQLAAGHLKGAFAKVLAKELCHAPYRFGRAHAADVGHTVLG